MIEVKLNDGRIWKFNEDISMKKLKDLGDEPTEKDSQEYRTKYNAKKICAFSFDPVLNEEMLDDLKSFDYMTIFKEILLNYNTKMVNFLKPIPKKQN